MKAERTKNPDIKKWDRIWKMKAWPKVALFYLDIVPQASLNL